MPHLTAIIQPRGPIVQLIVNTTVARRAALAAAGVAVPTPVLASLLLDTGAGMTCLCKSVITQLGLQPTGSIDIHTPSTGTAPHKCSTFDVDLIFPGPTSPKHVAAHPVVESDFAAQGIQGLIGRDILKDFRMTYSGPDNFVLLSY